MKLQLVKQKAFFSICFFIAAFISGCSDLLSSNGSESAINLCETKLKESLISPSSYKRQGVKYYQNQFTFNEFYESEGGDSCKPFTNNVCEDDNKKFFRAMSVKLWLLASERLKSVKSDQELLSIIKSVEVKPWPKVSSKTKIEADQESLEHSYKVRYGSGREFKLPAAIVFIEYDAVNAFNAYLRSTHQCRFMPTNSKKYLTSDMY